MLSESHSVERVNSRRIRLNWTSPVNLIVWSVLGVNKLPDAVLRESQCVNGESPGDDKGLCWWSALCKNPPKFCRRHSGERVREWGVDDVLCRSALCKNQINVLINFILQTQRVGESQRRRLMQIRSVSLSPLFPCEQASISQSKPLFTLTRVWYRS